MRTLYFILIVVISLVNVLFGYAISSTPIIVLTILCSIFVIWYTFYNKTVEKNNGDKQQVALQELEKEVATLKQYIDDNSGIYNYNQESISKYEQTITSLKSSLNESNEVVEALERFISSFVPQMTGEMYEQYVGYHLAGKGWTQIDYTPKSGDFGADIIAVDSNGNRACVQCKRYDGTVGVEAVQEVYSGKGYYRCQSAYVCCVNGYTEAAKKLAESLDVTLLTIR